MKKYLLLTIVFLICLLPINIYAEDGWTEEDGETYYYKDDEKVEGFQEIDGKNYFFGIGSRRLLHGWQYYNGRFYGDPETGEIKQGWQHIGVEDYYVKDNYMVEGFQEIDGNNYFFGIGSTRLLHGWQYYNGKFYADPETGEIKQGWQHIGVEDYYVKDNYMVEGFQEIEGKNYFFGIGSTRLLHGLQNYNGKFYADPETGEIKQGWQHIGSEDYYTEGNYFVEGFHEIDGKRYFFGIGSRRLLRGLQNYNGKFYADPTTGEIKQGWQHIGSEDYYTEGNYFVEGFKTIEGKIYFFGIGSRRLLHGWQTMNNQIWYQNENGELLTGNKKIDSRDYKFNEETGFLEGFKYENGKMYYYDPDGTLNKGIQYMAGRFWKFNDQTGAFEKHVRQIRVIDISRHNGNINWDQVKASGTVDAVILRLGYGDRWLDDRFLQNKEELERLGIPYSVYLFSYAENSREALAESNFVINTIKNNNVNIASNIFSIYYDLEDWVVRSTGENSYGISKDTYGDMITTFVDNVEKNLCIKTRVYASEYYVYNRFPEYTYKYATWIANWTQRGITYPYNYEGWQYTSSGSVPGIYGNVDMNIFYY